MYVSVNINRLRNHLDIVEDEIQRASHAAEALDLLSSSQGIDPLTYDISTHRQFILREIKSIRERKQLLSDMIDKLSALQP